jgi:FkbM family methyltransferase
VAHDAVCLDIGANIGVTGIALSRIARAGMVHAVEPDDQTFAVLEENLRANWTHNVKPIHALVGREGDEKTFLVNEANPTGSTSTHRQVVQEGLRPVKKRATSLDQLCADKRIGRVDFIKIEVEGAELEVLDGAAGILRRDHPLVQVEFNAHTLMNFGDINPPKAFEMIRELFPYVWRIAPDGALEPVTSTYAFMYQNVVEHGCVDDLLCSYEVPTPKRGHFFYDLQRSHAERDALVRDIADLKKTITGLYDTIRDLHKTIEGLNATIDAVRAEGAEGERSRGQILLEHARLSRELAEAESWLRATRQSTSWRITAPLRWLKGAR